MTRQHVKLHDESQVGAQGTRGDSRVPIAIHAAHEYDRLLCEEAQRRSGPGAASSVVLCDSAYAQIQEVEAQAQVEGSSLVVVVRIQAVFRSSI